MNAGSLLLVGVVADGGVLHRIVPDHWVPLTLIARQCGWSKVETACAFFPEGVGHVLSTLAIGLVVWIAGVAFAIRFGNIVDPVASLALAACGSWIMTSALREMRGSGAHAHSHATVTGTRTPFRTLEFQLHRGCSRLLAGSRERRRHSAGAHHAAKLGAHWPLRGLPVGKRCGSRHQQAPTQSGPRPPRRLMSMFSRNSP